MVECFVVCGGRSRFVQGGFVRMVQAPVGLKAVFGCSSGLTPQPFAARGQLSVC